VNPIFSFHSNCIKSSCCKNNSLNNIQEYIYTCLRFCVILLLLTCIICNLYTFCYPVYTEAFHQRYSKPKQRHSGVFWIFGDSVGDFFYRAVWNTPLCKAIFRTCGRSYNWVYILPDAKPPKSSELPYDFKDFDVERVINGLTEVLSRTTMNNESALFINFGLHFSMSISIRQFERFIDRVVDTFTSLKSSGVYNGTIIWKTTTAMQKWKFGKPESNGRHAKSHRFLTEPVSRIFYLTRYSSTENQFNASKK